MCIKVRASWQGLWSPKLNGCGMWVLTLARDVIEGHSLMMHSMLPLAEPVGQLRFLCVEPIYGL